MRTERTSEGYKHFEDCFLCGREFQYGAQRYAGRGVRSWNVLICEQCEAASWDGLVPQSHPRLMRHLADQGIAFQLSDKGWLPIPRD